MGTPLRTERLVIRDWTPSDAEAAFAIHGDGEVSRWLTPDTEPVRDLATMRSVLADWIAAQPTFESPAGRWAIARQEDDQIIGGLMIRYLPPDDEDLEIGWHLRPDTWGQGYATEAATALIRWAFEVGVDELYAVARPANERAIAMARRMGMQWVGETEKYYGLNLLVYRIRPGDLDDPVRTPTGVRSPA